MATDDLTDTRQSSTSGEEAWGKSITTTYRDTGSSTSAPPEELGEHSFGIVLEVTDRDPFPKQTARLPVPASPVDQYIQVEIHSIDERGEGASPAYRAARRRRLAGNVRVHLVALTEYFPEKRHELSDSIDIEEFDHKRMYAVHSLFTEVSAAIDSLQQLESRNRVLSEGSSLEILRLIRDSLITSTDDTFTQREVVAAVDLALARMISDETVPQDAEEQLADSLLEVGMEPYAALASGEPALSQILASLSLVGDTSVGHR